MISSTAKKWRGLVGLEIGVEVEAGVLGRLQAVQAEGEVLQQAGRHGQI